MTECNSNKFWQIWKANFKTSKGVGYYKFDGLTSDIEIANYLAQNHSLNCSPNNTSLNENLKQKFLSWNSSHGNVPFSTQISLSSVQIENAISKISNNTTSGSDNICIEHFKFAHPSIIIILKSIFNIFLSMGEVPSDFGLGLVTPIPKFKGHKKNVSADDFRGITLNVMSSKIFEHAISCFLSNISSSERQFGFKKGSSCSHALQQVKNTIQFFNNNKKYSQSRFH